MKNNYNTNYFNLKTLNSHNIDEEWEAFFNPLKGIYYDYSESDWENTIAKIMEDFYTYLMCEYDVGTDEGYEYFSKFCTSKAKWLSLDKKMWKINKKLDEINKDFE